MFKLNQWQFKEYTNTIKLTNVRMSNETCELFVDTQINYKLPQGMEIGKSEHFDRSS